MRIIALAASLIVTSPAFADDSLFSTETVYAQQFHARLSVGAFVQEGFSRVTSFSRTINTQTYTTDAGLSIAGAVGVSVRKWLSFEVEGSWSRAEVRSIKTVERGTCIDFVFISCPRGDGEILERGSEFTRGDGLAINSTVVAGFLNTTVSPLSDYRLSPYVGAGVGFAHWNVGSRTTTSPAAKVFGGVDWEPIDDLLIGVRADVMFIDSVFENDDGFSSDNGIAGVTYTGSVKYRF